MLNPGDMVNNVFQQIREKLPKDLGQSSSNIRQEVESNLRVGLQAAFNKLDLVSREEFDIQAELLAKARERLDELEKRVALLANPATALNHDSNA